MARRVVPEVPRICLHCGVAWVQRDGQAPRDYCTTSCRNEAERQARGVAVATDEAEPPPRTYVRHVRAQVRTITCQWCGQVATLEQYPGPVPRYCSPACRAEAAREGAAERLRRMRTRRQQPGGVAKA